MDLMDSSMLSNFGNWELIRQLGTGGFGEVTLWKNRVTNQEIATKRLKENNNWNKDEKKKLEQRWQKEYEWMLNLDTKYIVRGIHINDQAFVSYINHQHAWRPLPVIIMEYCNGGDLRTLLQKTENLNGLQEFDVRQILHALRHAVDYLHNIVGIEHRDLKPDNIVFHRENDNRTRSYKITDFGFARTITNETVLKSVVGTRNYFAPEVVDTAKYKNTVDYWSMGIIAFELICGFLPFIPHQELYQIITNIRKKPINCIAITEDPDKRKQFIFQEHILDETHTSVVFREKMENWLRIALDTDYQTRGSRLVSSKGEKSNTIFRTLTFYTELDEILQTKILSMFCLNTYKFYHYEVVPDLDLTDWLRMVESDTGIPKEKFFFVFPVGHPRSQQLDVVRPIDFFVQEWQDTSDNLNPPVMLYLVGQQCDYNCNVPFTSPNVQRCLKWQKNNSEDPSEWLLRAFERESYFLLSNEQRHLKAYLLGLKEYALTVEHDIFEYNKEQKQLQVLLGKMLYIQGRIEQFNSSINLARKVYEEMLKNCSNFFTTWSLKANTLAEEMRIHMNIGQSVENRYNSALRRAKESASTMLFEELVNKDIYKLEFFRKKLFEVQHHIVDKKVRRENCENRIYQCINTRKEFLDSPQLKDNQDNIINVQNEFTKIRSIVSNAHIILDQNIKNLDELTLSFYKNLITLLKVTPLNCINSNGLHCNGYREKIAEKSTVELIEETNNVLELMAMDASPKKLN